MSFFSVFASKFEKDVQCMGQTRFLCMDSNFEHAVRKLELIAKGIFRLWRKIIHCRESLDETVVEHFPSIVVQTHYNIVQKIFLCTELQDLVQDHAFCLQLIIIEVFGTVSLYM